MTGIEMLAQAPRARARRQAPAPHGVRRHRRRDHGDQRHRARLLPAQAVGPARRAALPRHRRPARRLAAGAPGRQLGTCGWSGTAGRSAATRSRPSSRATTCPTAGSTSSATRRRVGSSSSRTPSSTTCPSCSCPTASRSGRRRPSTWPVPSACGPTPSSRCTTCASSAAVRPAWRPRSTRRPRGCAPSWWSGRRRAAKPARAPRSRTTSGSRRGCRGPTSRTGRSPRPPGSARRWCWRATSWRSRAGARCGRCASATAEALEARALLVATGVSYRRLEAPGLEELSGRGVYYGATASEAIQCEGDDVYVVGAANSAGQAALNLARYAKRVVLHRARRRARGHHVALPRRPDPGGAEHRGAAAQRGAWRRAATATWSGSRWPTATPVPRRRW